MYPTDSSYAFGWHIGDKAALERVRRLRGIERDHDFTLACRDLSDIATYARVENWAYRLLKALTPGPYTFVLRATHQLPKRLQDPKRRSIGIRVPDHTIAQALLGALGEPLMSSTLLLPNDPLPLTEPEDIRDRLEQPGRRDHRRRRLRHRAHVGARLERRRSRGACGRARATSPHSEADRARDELRIMPPMFGMDPIELLFAISYGAIPVVFAITLHEVAHGWAAKQLGDPTASQARPAVRSIRSGTSIRSAP